MGRVKNPPLMSIFIRTSENNRFHQILMSSAQQSSGVWSQQRRQGRKGSHVSAEDQRRLFAGGFSSRTSGCPTTSCSTGFGSCTCSTGFCACSGRTTRPRRFGGLRPTSTRPASSSSGSCSGSGSWPFRGLLSRIGSCFIGNYRERILFVALMKLKSLENACN